MELREDFIYYSKVDNIEKVMKLKDKHFKESLDVLKKATKWVNGIFGELFNGVYVYVSDIPIVQTLAFMGIEEEKKEVTIYLNITAIIKSYETGKYVEDFVLSEELTCPQYVLFVFLHELGHLYYAIQKGDKHQTLFEKVERYIEKVQEDYHKFELDNGKLLDMKKERLLGREEEVELKVKYRQIPSEKEADEFAFKYRKKFENE